MAQTMRAIATEAQGSLDKLEVMDVPVPVPARGEVRVRVMASAVNPADYKIATGTSAARFLHARIFPLVVGYDFSGTVDAVGDQVDGLREGDHVFGHLPYSAKNRSGAFAENLIAAATAVGRKPDEVPHEEAAAAATAGLTALQALRDKGRLGEGGRAFVVGAAGGVGSLAVLVAGRLGARVVAVCGPETVDFVTGLGADEVIDRRGGDPLRRPDGAFDVVFDTPNAYSYVRCRHLLATGGAYVATLPTPALVTGKIASLFSSRRCALVVVRSTPADLEQLGAWMAGGMKVPVESRYPVREAAAAIADVHRGGRRGRVVIEVASGW